MTIDARNAATQSRMHRRQTLALIAAVPLAGCGLSTRAYVERREWPLDPARPMTRRAADGRRLTPPGTMTELGVLLLRAVAAGPAVAARGLQTLQRDGSVAVAFYDEWLAPPADLFEAALRQWLTDSGRFSAVVAPGARLDPTITLDCTLMALVADPGARRARCDAAILVTRAGRVLVQRAVAGRAPLADDFEANPNSAVTGAPATARALRAAAADACAQIEAALG